MAASRDVVITLRVEGMTGSRAGDAADREPPVTKAFRNATNDVRRFLGATRPIPPAIWVKGKPMHLRDEIEFTLDLARRRWAQKPEDLAWVVDSLVDSDRFLTAFWGKKWHEQVSW